MVETERLRIIPLKPDELKCYLQGGGKLEKLFKLKDTGRTVSPDVRDRVERIILPKMRHLKGDDYLFISFWIVVYKLSETIVAELGFKGIPDKEGVIEIGYGTLPSERGKGIMTESVSGMIRWAASCPGLTCITAETDKDNKASIRVMEKNDFTVFEEIENMKWWRRKLSHP